MKTKLKNTALVIALATSLSTAASGQVLQYADGDVFVGFRRTGTADTLAVNLGSAKRFLSLTQGGTNSSSAPFKVRFGLRPGTTDAVTNLAADLSTVFGPNWTNNPTNGSGVRWAVVGFSGNSSSALEGYGRRSIFVTAARTETNAEGLLQPVLIGADRFDVGDYSEFSTTFNSFAQGVGGGSFKNGTRTINSTVAYRGKAADENNWGSRIDYGAEGSFGLGALAQVEQTFGPKSGPTDSVLDFWASPDPGSTALSANTYLGSFTLNNFGELIYWPAASNAPVPLINVAASPINGSVGASFQYRISASNFPSVYGASNLPAGLTVNADTGLIIGTPTAPGTNNVLLSATNPFGSGSNNLTLIFTLPPAPAITGATTASGTVGTAFSYQITASGNPTNFAASGLPAGLSISPTSGLISGKPAAAGTSKVNISASNAGGTASRQLTINVVKRAQTISFTQPTPQKFKKGATFRLSAKATSGLKVTFVSLTPKIVRVRDNVATILAVGDARIAARQNGNSTFAPAREATRTVKIRK